MQVQHTARSLQLLFWLTLAAFHSTASGAEPSAYQVEMIIFAHENAPQITSGVPAQTLPSTGDAEQLAGDPQGKYFHALPSSELSLATAESILQNSSSYEVIEHVAWRQPGLGENAAKAVHIQGGPEYRTSPVAPQGYESSTLYADAPVAQSLKQLDGTVKVVLGQYLHLYTDLVLRRPVTTETLDDNQQSLRTNALYQFSIQKHRRMRSKELHYLDHPLLGILVQITPVEEKVTRRESAVEIPAPVHGHREVAQRESDDVEAAPPADG
jgi:hypothetical protein